MRQRLQYKCDPSAAAQIAELWSPRPATLLNRRSPPHSKAMLTSTDGTAYSRRRST
jgi:hypothetical protein